MRNDVGANCCDVPANIGGGEPQGDADQAEQSLSKPTADFRRDRSRVLFEIGDGRLQPVEHLRAEVLLRKHQ